MTQSSAAGNRGALLCQPSPLPNKTVESSKQHRQKDNNHRGTEEHRGQKRKVAKAQRRKEVSFDGFERPPVPFGHAARSVHGSASELASPFPDLSAAGFAWLRRTTVMVSCFQRVETIPSQSPDARAAC